jgi:alpha-tubulin suppressor-like RCC1 family protein
MRVAIHGGTSLVITSTGQLFAFGDNDFGELGNATMTANPTPTLVTLLGATGPVVDAAGGKTSIWPQRAAAGPSEARLRRC